MASGWSETTIGGHPCEIFEPTERSEWGYAALYLHGVHLTRLSTQPAFTAEFERHGLVVVSPMTQRSWWTDRICEEFDAELTAERHLLSNVVPFLGARFEAHPPRIGLLGTSMGGQGALRIAYKHPDRFPVVSAIAPAIDFHTRHRDGDEPIRQMYPDAESARQDTALLHIHPLHYPRQQFFCCDPMDERWWESSDRLHMKLASLGVPHEHDLDTSAGGHGFEYYNHMAARAIGFLVAGLESERGRLL